MDGIRPQPVSETISKEELLSAPPVASDGKVAIEIDMPVTNGMIEKKRKKHEGETPEERTERKRKKKEKNEKKEAKKGKKGSKPEESDESN
jgi:H/ACA ribonucleoprotein complex subunit 4